MPRTRATKPADKADRIDTIVVTICGTEEQYRETVAQVDMARVISRSVLRAVLRTELWAGNRERWRHM